MDSVSIGPLVLLQPVWLIAALLLLILALHWRAHVPVNDWQSIMSDEVFQFLTGKSRGAGRVNWLLCTASLIALCFTQPVLRQSDDDTWRHSIGWIAVIDVSRSMTLSDVVPSRLSAARRALTVFSAQSGARPIAMIIYAGDAFLVAPPAFDKSVFNEHAALLEHGVIDTDGSNLARALSLATSVVADSGFVATRVFVLSDTGGINASSISAAGYLSGNGHSVDVLVFGSTTPADQSSQTRVDADLAKELANAGGGKALFANAFGVIDYSLLSLHERVAASELADLKTLIWKDQFYWVLLLAIPLLLLQFRKESHL